MKIRKEIVTLKTIKSPVEEGQTFKDSLSGSKYEIVHVQQVGSRTHAIVGYDPVRGHAKVFKESNSESCSLIIDGQSRMTGWTDGCLWYSETETTTSSEYVPIEIGETIKCAHRGDLKNIIKVKVVHVSDDGSWVVAVNEQNQDVFNITEHDIMTQDYLTTMNTINEYKLISDIILV